MPGCESPRGNRRKLRTARSRPRRGCGRARNPVAPLPGMLPYVLSLMHARAHTFEIRGSKHRQGSHDDLERGLRGLVRRLVLSPARTFDAQPSAFYHEHHLGIILNRAHNLGDDLRGALFCAPPWPGANTKFSQNSAKYFLRPPDSYSLVNTHDRVCCICAFT